MGDGLDDWDQEFLDVLIQIEEQVIANSQVPPSSTVTHSPPRHLSQRSSSSAIPPPRAWTSQKPERIGSLKGEVATKSKGVQTDETAQPTQSDDKFMSDNLTNKLLAIWGSPKEQDLGKIVISHLDHECKADFRSLEASRSDPEAAKIVSHLHSVFTEVSNGMIKLDALFQPLVDLCSLKIVAIVQASLHMLLMFLKNLLSLERQVEGRGNVKIEGLCRNLETESNSGVWNNAVANLIDRIDWVSLAQLIVQTTMRNTEHCIRVEAVSIMNVIVMGSAAFKEREKFGEKLVFEMIAKFLAKEAGFEVRKQAVQLLFLLLNCPKILEKFCSSYNEEMDAGAMKENAGDALNDQTYCMILQGLADCLACCGDCGREELVLCENTVHLLAFMASSGKYGFDILASHKLLKDANFLVLMLQILAAEADQRAVNTSAQQFIKERTLLIRETLILLNRLVSNPSYSATVLRVLTNSRDMASLAIDVASRLSRKDQIYEKFGSGPKSDIGDLARIFKKRVFTYLG